MEDPATASGADAAPHPDQILTKIPARMDRLPWSRFHRLVVAALGITWIFDGLEVTLKGAISGVLQEPETLHFTSAQIGSITSFYLLGAVSGSLIFGYLTDRHAHRHRIAHGCVLWVPGGGGFDARCGWG